MGGVRRAGPGGPGGPGPASSGAMCHSHSPTEAEAGGRAGLAFHAPSHDILAAAAGPGHMHTGQSDGRDEIIHSQELETLDAIHCRTVSVQCWVLQMGEGVVGCLCTLCGNHAETQTHIQCLCLCLQEADGYGLGGLPHRAIVPGVFVAS